MITFSKAHEIKDKHSARLLQVPGVWGVGIEKGENNQPILVIHTDGKNSEAFRNFPSEIEGVRLKVIEDGPFIKRARR